MIIPARQSDIKLLLPEMQVKVNALLSAAKLAGLNIQVFETLRTRERQAFLFGKGRTPQQCKDAGLKLYDQWSQPNDKIVTSTMNSQHLVAKAADLVFIDNKGNPTWVGDWQKVIALAKQCGLTSLYPYESSHVQIN